MALATTLACVLWVVVAAAGAGQRKTVLYPKYVAGGLVCYRDNRSDGGAFWSYANDQQRRPYVFHCPSSLSAWCVNMVTGQMSVRGCSGPASVNQAGCFRLTDPQQNVTSKVCLCNRNYCNVADTSQRPPSALSNAALTMLAVIIDRYLRYAML